MSPSTTQLLSCVYEAVKDLEDVYGPADQGVLDAKRVLGACLSSVRLIETPEEAQLFSCAHQLVNAQLPGVRKSMADLPGPAR